LLLPELVDLCFRNAPDLGLRWHPMTITSLPLPKCLARMLDRKKRQVGKVCRKDALYRRSILSTLG
jgi:hypothetical protein